MAWGTLHGPGHVPQVRHASRLHLQAAGAQEPEAVVPLRPVGRGNLGSASQIGVPIPLGCVPVHSARITGQLALYGHVQYHGR